MIVKNHTASNLMGGGWFNWGLKILGLFLVSISFVNLIFSNNTFALFTPTLSAAIDNPAVSVNGNEVVNSSNKTTEIPLSLTVNTNNKTGYTITLNSETDENALVNTNSATNAKIDSISSASILSNFSNNTWGVKFGTNANFSPIPKLTSPTNIAQTTTKTNGNEVSNINLGLKLGNNLESGSYKNKLIFSILTNRYDPIAKMTTGPNFNSKLVKLQTATNRIEHFKKSATAPAAIMNAVNVEAPESECEIKLWLDPSDKTAYYYAEPEKVYLNEDSSSMFSYISSFEDLGHVKDLDLSNFDTSKVTNMRYMFPDIYNLTTLDLSNFNTSNVTDMDWMFYGSHKLTSLNLSNFDTSKVTTMHGMFYGDESITTLDLSNFNTSNVTDMYGMFYLYNGAASSDQLKTIYVKNDFDTTKLTGYSDMFKNRKKLRGGAGSYLADPSTADKSWLRIDDPAHGRPGYFTRKP